MSGGRYRLILPTSVENVAAEHANVDGVTLNQRSMSDLEGVAVNQLINVAIAEKLAQIRTAKCFADRIAAASPKAGTQLIQDLSRGGVKGLEGTK